MSQKTEILYGKNVVFEVLRANKRKVKQIFWARSANDQRSQAIRNIIREKKLPVKELNLEQVSEITHSRDHQGIACEVSLFEYTELDFVVKKAKSDPKGGFLLLLDEIQDPHNVGALIRTAYFCGASGMVLLKNRQALINATVCKAASGAEEYLPIVKEVNLVNVIKYLKSVNFFIYGSMSEGNNSIFSEKFKFTMGLILGSEGKGIKRLVKENCDARICIPTDGVLDSLNVSVAGGIIMGEIFRQRLAAVD